MVGLHVPIDLWNASKWPGQLDLSAEYALSNTIYLHTDQAVNDWENIQVTRFNNLKSSLTEVAL